MNRRELLRHSALAGAWLIQGGAPRDSASADPLYRPDLVQSRGTATAQDNDPGVKEIEHRLKCTCGCNLDIYTCRTTDFTCTYSPALHTELLALRAAGKAPDEVVAAFVAKYGEQILMAPKPEGFNIAGYLVPGVLMLVAGSLLTAFVVRRGRQPVPQGPGAPSPATGVPAPNEADAERLRRALEDVEA